MLPDARVASICRGPRTGRAYHAHIGQPLTLLLPLERNNSCSLCLQKVEEIGENTPHLADCGVAKLAYSALVALVGIEEAPVTKAQVW